MTVGNDNHDPIDTAWRIHGAVADWTGKAESKASFALAVETGTLIAVIGLAGSSRRLAHLHHAALVWFEFGLVFLIGGLLAVIGVGFPRLRWRKLESEVAENFVFFGHLCGWKADELEEALKSKPVLPMLSRQLHGDEQDCLA